MSTLTSPRLSLLALTSAVLGLLCFTGPVAVVIGWLALRAINQSEGRLRGARLAISGLVTGGIGVLLLGLGMVAVILNTLREQSNRVECRNNLGVIGLAVNVFADQNGHEFPPAVLPLAGHPPEDHLSWQAGILPMMGLRPKAAAPLEPLFLRLNLDRPWDDPVNEPVARVNVFSFLCRSNPYFDPRHTPGQTHYVGIAGLGDDAARLPKTDRAAGFFGYDRVIKMADISAGASCTYLAIETSSDNGPWAAGGPPTVRGVAPDANGYIGPGQAFGGCHRNGAMNLATVGYVDASVRFVAAAIEPRVFRSAARLAIDPDAK